MQLKCPKVFTTPNYTLISGEPRLFKKLVLTFARSLRTRQVYNQEATLVSYAHYISRASVDSQQEKCKQKRYSHIKLRQICVSWSPNPNPDLPPSCCWFFENASWPFFRRICNDAFASPREKKDYFICVSRSLR